MTRRAPAAALVTAAALAAGGCGTGTSPTADLFRIPGITAQTLLGDLQQPTSRGPGGYPVIAGPERLSLHGIQYTTQGRAALQLWFTSSPGKQPGRYRQAGHNLAIAFPSDRSQINSKIR